MPAHAVGLYLALNLLGMWLGSLTASRLIGKVPLARLMVIGKLLSCAAAAAFLASVLTGALSVPVTVLSLLVLTYGGGIASPTALAQAPSVDPLVVGSASGLYGFARMVIGALCASLAGIGGDPAPGWWPSCPSGWPGRPVPDDRPCRKGQARRFREAPAAPAACT